MNGYRVLEANSGQEALHLIEADPDSVDLLLTDIIMPDMNGQELAERTHRLHPEIKVLLISGYTDRSDFHEWAARLGVVFLPKPFNVEELERTVREVLDGFCPVHEPPLPASALSWTIP
jgi:YesN/AraC family two-component response regulator